MDNIIKSFLVGLGFGVDEKSLSAFNNAILKATLKVTALYGSIKLASAGIFFAISKISQSFEDMGYQLRIVAPAVNRFLVMRQAMLTAYAKAGVDLTQVVKQSILFNYSLAKTKFAFEALVKGTAARFLPMLTKQMDIFRAKIFANMPKIQNQLEKFIKFIFQAFQATAILGNRIWSILTRVYDFFERLHKATDGWSTVLLGVIAAWKLLNLSFLATPLGMIIGGLLTILALYDDFKVWQEGGKSLFDWGSETARIIEGLVAAAAALTAGLIALKVVMLTMSAASKAWAVGQVVLNGILAIFAGELSLAAAAAVILEAPIWLIVAAVTALVGALTAADAKWKIFGGGLAGFFSGVGGKVLDFFGGGPKSMAAVGVGGQGGPSSQQPLLPPSAQSQQNINQQTSITVNGAADAHSVGRNVTGAQDRVNFDMTRNLKGATQ